uniref:Uncharacterized protein isoform X3 n=1 Tax=Pogona vitticeps TaxID=103695 RepID=A0ABM5FT16_9SAUR
MSRRGWRGPGASAALLLLLNLGWAARASEITFELPDNAKQCFYEEIVQGTKCTLEFQVITGGHYDVDCRLEDPDGIVLYKEMKKQYDSFTFTASRNGTYKFCFSNEFSTFTHKTVYFDFQVGDDPPLFPSENRVTALTQMESACVSIHEALKSVIDYQTHFRLREAQGRSRAEDLNTRVAYWNSVRDNCIGKREENTKPMPKLCELSLHTEASCHVTVQEVQRDNENTGDIFYRFVILHAENDVEEAVRIQELLQNEFCIKPGIIFAEMPSGRHLLENLNDALSNSAWTIILLTENFLSELWYQFQSYTSLLSSLTVPHKRNTVIPMRPRNNPLPWERTPFILQTISTLQEDSPGFAEQIRKTFQESTYKHQQVMWQYGKKNAEAQKPLMW